MTDSWFEIISHTDDECLEQGDVLMSCSYPVRKGCDPDGGINVEVYEDVIGIVLSQSCDLFNKKIENVVLCACLPLEDYIEQRIKSQNPVNKNNIKSELTKMCKIEAMNTFLLKMDKTFLVVNFDDIFSFSYDDANKIFKEQTDIIRMKSPYRECLSQMFARSFMRVGTNSRIVFDDLKPIFEKFFP